MARDTAWMLTELRTFVADSTEARDSSPLYAATHNAPALVLLAQAEVVEQILARVLPNWRSVAAASTRDRWQAHREAAIRAIALLHRESELRDKLGEDAPALSAAAFHPWAWDGARSMWASGHYNQAVVNALGKVQAETQNKTGRHDLSETKLFTEVFAPSPPKAGSPRLRVDDTSDTYKSAQRGAMTLAEGLFAGIRNVAVHTVAETEADQQQALEQLAAVSVLARWVDAATLETAS